MNTTRAGRSIELEEAAKISFCGPYIGNLDEVFYQKEAKWEESTAQICAECDVIWFQTNQ